MGKNQNQPRRKGLFSIEELQDLVERDGLGVTVAYGVAGEHVEDIELRNLWTVAQTYLLRIQDYLDAKDNG